MNVLTVKLWGEKLGRLVWDQVRKTNFASSRFNC